MPILMREHGVEDYYVEFWRLWINALRHTQPHFLAYLIYMVQRLLHMKSIFAQQGPFTFIAIQRPATTSRL